MQTYPRDDVDKKDPYEESPSPPNKNWALPVFLILSVLSLGFILLTR